MEKRNRSFLGQIKKFLYDYDASGKEKCFKNAVFSN